MVHDDSLHECIIHATEHKAGSAQQTDVSRACQLVQMDNMFVPNHWESYCTDTGSNVNCVGVLMDPDSFEVDLEAAAHRNYLMKRLRYASQQVFQGPT